MTAVAAAENPLVEGLERLPVPATTLVIFGATGDLARRKLLPALYNLAHEGALPERFNLVGISRSAKEHREYREQARDRYPRWLAGDARGAAKEPRRARTRAAPSDLQGRTRRRARAARLRR